MAVHVHGFLFLFIYLFIYLFIWGGVGGVNTFEHDGN